MEVPEWYSPKHYIHIGLPLTLRDFKKVNRLLKNKKWVANYAFLPLIHREIKEIRVKRLDKKKKRKKTKIRNICFASHLDATIYSYYNHLLSECYEERIKYEGIDECVIAYRRIPKNDGKKGNKCNIDFARDVFTAINQLGAQNQDGVAVIIADITGFFDNLDHAILKKKWKDVMNLCKLPEDVYNIYKNVTRFSYIDERMIFEHFQNRIICRIKKSDKNHVIRRKRTSKLKYLKKNDAIAFCERNEISEIKHLISTRRFQSSENLRDEAKGIPQGLPISATLANVYMLDFDNSFYNYINKYGGVYRRYSDDIAVVIPVRFLEEAFAILLNHINSVKLEIKKEKTSVYIFKKEDNGELICTQDGQPSKLSYLGFSYDGRKILIKEKSLSKFFHRFDKTLVKMVHYCRSFNNPEPYILFENRLLKRFTKIGYKFHSRNISESKLRQKKQGGRSKHHKYGNYLSYARRASEIFQSPEIMHQLSRNLYRVKSKVKKCKDFLDWLRREN